MSKDFEAKRLGKEKEKQPTKRSAPPAPTIKPLPQKKVPKIEPAKEYKAKVIQLRRPASADSGMVKVRDHLQIIKDHY